MSTATYINDANTQIYVIQSLENKIDVHAKVAFQDTASACKHATRQVHDMTHSTNAKIVDATTCARIRKTLLVAWHFYLTAFGNVHSLRHATCCTCPGNSYSESTVVKINWCYGDILADKPMSFHCYFDWMILVQAKSKSMKSGNMSDAAASEDRSDTGE